MASKELAGVIFGRYGKKMNIEIRLVMVIASNKNLYSGANKIHKKLFINKIAHRVRILINRSAKLSTANDKKSMLKIKLSSQKVIPSRRKNNHHAPNNISNGDKEENPMYKLVKGEDLGSIAISNNKATLLPSSDNEYFPSVFLIKISAFVRSII
jgi:hypothetical protein